MCLDYYPIFSPEKNSKNIFYLTLFLLYREIHFLSIALSPYMNMRAIIAFSSIVMRYLVLWLNRSAQLPKLPNYEFRPPPRPHRILFTRRLLEYQEAGQTR